MIMRWNVIEFGGEELKWLSSEKMSMVGGTEKQS